MAPIWLLHDDDEADACLTTTEQHSCLVEALKEDDSATWDESDSDETETPAIVSASEDSKVRFHLHATSFHDVVSRNDLSEQECNDMWFSKAEIIEASKRNRKTLQQYEQRLQAGKDEQRLKLKIRGLEQRLNKSKCKTIKVNAIYSVLKLQASLRKAGEPIDPQELAATYVTFCTASIQEALERGQGDQLVATTVWEEPDDTSVDDSDCSSVVSSGTELTESSEVLDEAMEGIHKSQPGKKRTRWVQRTKSFGKTLRNNVRQIRMGR